MRAAKSIFGSGLCLLLLGGFAAAAPPVGVGVPEASGALGKTRTAVGVVKRFTSNERGDVNGMVLDTGTIVRFWPHLAKRLTAMAAIGDRVEVMGQMHTADRDVTALYASTIKNLSTRVRKLNEDLPPRPVPAPTRTARGRVSRVTTEARGQVDGVELDNGTVVHWSPLESRFANAVTKGDRVEVTGVQKTTARGDTVLQAYVLTNLTTRKTVRRGGPLPADAPLAARPVPLAPAAEGAVPARPVTVPAAPNSDAVERRLRALEVKMDRLLEEMKQLRKQQQ
jgi:hypothetical protein